MFESLLIAAALTVVDPPGDTVGDGGLTPPTAAVYRNLAPFDLRGITIPDDGGTLTLLIEMGSLSNPFELPLGFSLPIIDVYVGGEEGTGTSLPEGSGMRLPEGRTWEVAVRVSGERALATRVTAGGSETVAATVTADGDLLVVSTPFPRPDAPVVYAATGLYDLFGADPWRQLSTVESPWAFSHPDASRLPAVVDVLAPDAAAQSAAVASGILPPAGGRTVVPGAAWLLVMAAGMALALIGVVTRIASARGRREETAGEETASDSPPAVPTAAPSPSDPRDGAPASRPVDHVAASHSAIDADEAAAQSGRSPESVPIEASVPSLRLLSPAQVGENTPSDRRRSGQVGAGTSSEEHPSGERSSTEERRSGERPSTEEHRSGERPSTEEHRSSGRPSTEEHLSGGRPSLEERRSGERRSPAAAASGRRRFEWDSSIILERTDEDDRLNDEIARQFAPPAAAKASAPRRTALQVEDLAEDDSGSKDADRTRD